jgi:hypothetical protein
MGASLAEQQWRRSREGTHCAPLHWTIAILAACLAIAAGGAAVAAQQEMLYPHAEREGGPWGYIDKTGKVIVPLQFDWAEPFSEGLAAVSLNKKFGYIDNTGRFVIAPQYTGGRFGFADASFQNSRAVVMDGEEARLIDHDGNIIIVDRPGARILPRMDPIGNQDEPGYRKPADDDRILIKSVTLGAIDLSKSVKLGAIDLSGRTIIEPEYDRMEPFSEGLAAVYRGGKVGFVDRDGKLVIPIEIEGFSIKFLDGRAKVTKTQPWHHCGFIDRTGKLIIPDIYSDCQDFHEGRAAVKVDPQGWGIIDLDGRFVVPPQFTRVDTSAFPIHKGKPFGRGGFTSHGRGGFSEGLMAVSSKDGYGYRP